jgi:3-oxoacyl-[acyl-carrier protein] reductase
MPTNLSAVPPVGPLTGRIALVTGVSRQIGIAASVARRLLRDGASVFATGWHPHDHDMPWGADVDGPDGLRAFMSTESASDIHTRFHYEEADLAIPATAEHLVTRTIAQFGAIDIVVAVHARSSSNRPLRDLLIEELDGCWNVNTRGTLLLAKAMQHLRDSSRVGGRFVSFTSGQHLGPMANELPYAISKGAIQQMTASLSDAMIDDGITVNCINPGPVDTGWATPDLYSGVEKLFPAQRWGQPSDIANVVAFLVSDNSAWITGQTINAEGGWRR